MTDQPLGATVADRLSALLGGGVTGVRAVTGGRPAAYRATIGGDRHLLAKWWPDAPPGFFDAEARGLAWLGEAAPGLVPTVVAAADDLIAMEWLEQTAPTAAAAERLGRSLARLHHGGAPTFGAPWQGYIGPLPMDNRPLAGWPEFYAERRVVPYLRLAADRGSLARSDAAAVEEVLSRVAELAGPAEPPARLQHPGELAHDPPRPNRGRKVRRCL